MSSSSEPTSPHDALFYRTFSQPENAASELKHVLPKELVARIDWSSLKIASTRFVDPKLSHRHADLFYAVNISTPNGAEPAYLHILFEHESEGKPWSLLQALGYQVRRWDEESRLPIQRGRKRLTPIITVILHHGEAGFTSSVRFRDYFQLDDDLCLLLSPYLVDFGVLVDDVGKVNSEALIARPVSLEVQLILFVLRFARTPERFLQELPKVVPLIVALHQQEDGNRCIGTVFLYVERVAKIPASELRMALQQAYLTDEALIEEILHPGRLAERLTRELEHRGRELEQSRLETERAKREQSRSMLLQLLSQRFGPLPSAGVARIDVASVAELEAMALRVLSSTTLEEVLNGSVEPGSK